MRAILQRVSSCSVSVDGEEISRIGRGLLVFLGVSRDDSLNDVEFIVKKTADLRVFDDREGKMNLSLRDVGGEIMLVSQFTLYADTRKGKRPAYTQAAHHEHGKELYEAASKAFYEAGFPPATGAFGAHMAVKLENDGPVTILLES
ncbi:MAG: D-tyrosyl-tRNA(Tyr) deacylase [Actinobacteria bacterium RBG_19FT_COMBO_54_7]|uniref:D-aminoacyl-tRNA deacylase n=1 Tax=Candidatus Solincola sediminis TaxID=1797199 RepID=A0A1F2WFQ7_9ACTN|nr:MAG: D-tyrosyl-tRNA(Tyr) deacylase [Candidatus Solincola sediminis]OFW58097.1 MAG: D-tyrosyl-tRNA(Tyr) deacylase [Candidatus Solincola sediminis]OFW66099.1 MAG: D-tyrosyl-tRNA(Tyr) deacylase [Actinobacteria bacterium RBG_19FT_COMBO_54_7]